MRRALGTALLALLAPLGAPRAEGRPEGLPRVLQDGVVVQGALPSGGGTWTARVDVPPDGVLMGVALSGDRDVDLFLERGQPPPSSPAATADLSALGTGAQEVLVLTPLSTPALRPGPWYVTVENAASFAARFEVVLLLDRRGIHRTVLPGHPARLPAPGPGNEVRLRTWMPTAVEEVALAFSRADLDYALRGPRGLERAGALPPDGILRLAREDAAAGVYRLGLSAREDGPPEGTCEATATWTFSDGRRLPPAPAPVMAPGDRLEIVLGGPDRADSEVLAIEIPAETYAFVLEATNPDELDVDLYARRDRPPENSDKDGEWFAIATGPSEKLVVGGVAPLPAGTYHVRVVLIEDSEPVAVTLVLRGLRTRRGLRTWGHFPPPALVEDGWAEGAVHVAESAVDWHLLEVPAGTRRLHVQLLEATGSLDLLLARRTDGGILHRAFTPLVNEHLEFALDDPPSATERYLVGVVNRSSWQREEVTYRIGAALDRRPRLPPDLVWPPLLETEGRSLVERMAAATVEVTIEDASGGSGVCVSPRGLVLTCRHCLVPDPGGEVQRDRVLVAFPEALDRPPHQVFYARVRDELEETDLALLEPTQDVFGRAIPAELRFPWIPLADSGALRLGDALYVAGYPEVGSEGHRTPIVVSRGIVSGLERRDGLPHWIKTDAWIAPGHSGGPVLDVRGGLVGISAATLGDTESLGLAIPVSRLPEDWKALVAEESR